VNIFKRPLTARDVKDKALSLGAEIVGIADEIPIGEEQQLDQVIGRPARALGFQRASWDCRDVYVSHIDISRIDCY